MKLRKITLFSLLSMAVFVGCEKLAEEDTPVCKDCYEVVYSTPTNQALDTPDFKRLSGGEAIMWENFADSINDSVTVKYFCR